MDGLAGCDGAGCLGLEGIGQKGKSKVSGGTGGGNEGCSGAFRLFSASDPRLIHAVYTGYSLHTRQYSHWTPLKQHATEGASASLSACVDHVQSIRRHIGVESARLPRWV